MIGPLPLVASLLVLLGNLRVILLQQIIVARHEALLVNGYVLDPEFRGRIRTVPSGLYFPRPPRGMRYVVIGGHVVLIDNGYRVHDVLHFEVNF